MVALTAHPLDNPIWAALTTRQVGQSLSDGQVRRYHPAFSPFAASAEGTAESLIGLASLAAPGEQVILQQKTEIAPPPGFILVRSAPTVQMVAGQIEGPPAAFNWAVLTEVDGPDMLALARLTRPGPFAERTHELGRFVGVRIEGELVAMAGERMKSDRFTEVSGVCTHPQHRGKGYAAGLMREVAREILTRGETPFLHAFENNTDAIALYDRLGFSIRWRPALMVLERVTV